MAPDDDLKKRVAHRLTKMRRQRRQPTIDMPERFRDGDDADDDCTAPHGANTYMNQSVFGMIAAAGSQVDFNARFDPASSDDDDGSVQPPSRSSDLQAKAKAKASPQEQAPATTNGDQRPELQDTRATQAIQGSLSLRPDSRVPSRTASPAVEPPSEHPISHGRQQASSDASVMKRMLEARAELSTRGSFDLPRLSEEGAGDSEAGDSSSLARRLMEIFHFESPELVLSGTPFLPSSLLFAPNKMLIQAEYPCWLLQSVLLQGYMYVTSKHICFYAYLPKKSVSCSAISL